MLAQSVSCAVTLACDSVSASKSKCGFQAYDGSAAYYLTKTVDTNFTFSQPISESDCGSDTGTYSGSLSANDIYSVDPSTCETSCAGTGSAESSYTLLYSSVSCSGTRNMACGFFVGTFHEIFCGTDFGVTPWTNLDLLIDGENVPNSQCVAPSGIPSITTTATTKTLSFTGRGDLSATLSNEYTTDQLKTNVDSALPPYCGVFGCFGRSGCTTAGQGCSCSAIYNLSTDETSLTIQRFMAQLSWSDPGTDAIISWTEHFVPEGGGSPTDTQMTFKFTTGGATVYTLRSRGARF